MDDPTDKLVHWQSAFWALTTVALNTSLQESGPVLGLSFKYRRALRWSPIFCLFDTVDIGIQIVRQARETDIRRAIALVAESRSKAAPQKHTVEDQPSFVRLLQRLLSIATLSQTVKIFACRGILRTQVAAATYLLSYGMQELLDQAGKESWLVYHLLTKDEKEATPSDETAEEEENEEEEISEEIRPDVQTLDNLEKSRLRHLWPVVLATFLQCLLSICILQALFPGRKTMQSNILLFSTVGLLALVVCVIILTLYWLFIFSLLLFPAFALYAYILSAIFTPLMLLYNKLAFVLRTRRPLTVPITVVVGGAMVLEVLVGLGFLYWQVWHTGYLFPWHFSYIFKHTPKPSVSWIMDEDWPYRTAGAILAFVSVALTSLYLCRLACNEAHQGFTHMVRRQAHDDVWGASFLVLMNFMTVLLYYVSLYKEHGTFRPRWTAYLG